MARSISTTSPSGVSGKHLDAILEHWALDPSARDANIGDLTGRAMAVAATDPATALELLEVARTLTAGNVNPWLEARTAYTHYMIGSIMMGTLSDAARHILDAGNVEVDQAIVDRIGDAHQAPAPDMVPSGQKFGVNRPRRATAPWIRAALEANTGTWMTHAEIAAWAETPGNGDRFGLTDTDTLLTGRIGAFQKGAAVKDMEDIMCDHTGSHRGAVAMMHIG